MIHSLGKKVLKVFTCLQGPVMIKKGKHEAMAGEWGAREGGGMGPATFSLQVRVWERKPFFKLN